MLSTDLVRVIQAKGWTTFRLGALQISPGVVGLGDAPRFYRTDFDAC